MFRHARSPHCSLARAERGRRGRCPQVRYSLRNRVCSGDLVFQEGRPVLVISWRTLDWKRIPYICIPLDADKLRATARSYVYIDEGDLTDSQAANETDR